MPFLLLRAGAFRVELDPAAAVPGQHHLLLAFDGGERAALATLTTDELERLRDVVDRYLAGRRAAETVAAARAEQEAERRVPYWAR